MFRVDETMCMGCGTCTGVCAPGAITLVEDTATIDESLCTQCGACLDVCPSGAIREVIVPEVVREPAQPAIRSPSVAPRATGVVASIAALAPVAVDIVSRVAGRWLGPSRAGGRSPVSRLVGGRGRLSMRDPGANGNGIGLGPWRRGRGRGGRGMKRRGRWS